MFKFLKGVIVTICCCVQLVHAEAAVQSHLGELLGGYCAKNNLFSTSSSSNGGSLIFLSGRGHIRYAQAFYYSSVENEICSSSSLLATASVIDNAGVGVPVHEFTPEGEPLCETLQLNGPRIYSMIGGKGVTPESVKCMQVFFAGGSESFKGMPCQNFTDLVCDSSTQTCTSSQIKAVNWEPAPTACTPRYAYITNINTNSQQESVVVCEVGNPGLSNCSFTASGVEFSSGIFANNGSVYVSNPLNNKIYQCAINPTSRTLTGCTAVNKSITAPQGITVNAEQVYVQGMNGPNPLTDSTIFQCSIESDGALSCVDDRFSGSIFFPIDSVAYNETLFVTNYRSGEVTQCSLLEDPSTCSNATSTSFDNPTGITIAGDRAYVVSSSNNEIKSCAIRGNSLQDCALVTVGMAKTTDVLDLPQGIQVIGEYVYIISQLNSTIFYCSIASDTEFTDCTPTGIDVIWNNPQYMTIY